MVFGAAVPAAAWLLAAMMDLVDGRPRTTLGLIAGSAALFVALLDVLGLTLLFIRVMTLVSSRHSSHLLPASNATRVPEKEMAGSVDQLRASSARRFARVCRMRQMVSVMNHAAHTST